MVYERAHVESVLFCELVDAAAIKIVINTIVVFRLLCHLVTLSTSLILIAIGFFLISRWDASVSVINARLLSDGVLIIGSA